MQLVVGGKLNGKFVDWHTKSVSLGDDTYVGYLVVHDGKRIPVYCPRDWEAPMGLGQPDDGLDNGTMTEIKRVLYSLSAEEREMIEIK